MNFVKYGSIENHYRTKFFERFDLADYTYAISEKLDGANFQIGINREGGIHYGSRNQILNETDNFYNWQEAVKKIDLTKTIEYAKLLNVDIILYGELHGKGVQNRVIYQDEKMIRFFDIMINGKFQSFEYFEEFTKEHGLDIVPVYLRGATIDEVMDYDVDHTSSHINPIEDNIIEGIVARPYYKDVYIGSERLILKKKSEKAKEKKKKKKKKKTVDPVVSKWYNVFNEYINESRVFSVFSKVGVIEDHKDIGKYITMVIEDAWEDFLKDNPEFVDLKLEKKQIKAIKNTSKEIVNILKKHL